MDQKRDPRTVPATLLPLPPHPAPKKPFRFTDWAMI